MKPLENAHFRFGWVGLFVWLLLGYILEILHGFKSPAYLQDELRRELWTLAHLHGAMLSLLNLMWSRWAGRAGRPASISLRAGSVLLPVGFLLGGWVHYEGDPGPGIFLAPAGATLVLIAVGIQAFGTPRSP